MRSLGDDQAAEADAERWPVERLAAWQLDRLCEVIDFARKETPFYRRLWSEHDLTARKLERLEDLKHFPITTKEDLLRGGSADPTPGEGPVGFSTRGTSGKPLVVWLSAEEEEVYVRPTMRGFRWAGLKKGMTALLTSPVWHRLAACEAHAVARIGGRCAFFWGSILNPRHVESFLRTLDEVRPEFVTTTAPFLFWLVRHLESAGNSHAGALRNVAAIVVVGLPLTPRLREHLCQRLEVGDIFERGGTQEGAALDECAVHSAPHVHEDVCYLEVVDPQGRPVPAGRRGNLVVTKLASAGSIFVRYNTGDIAAFVPGRCPCGSSFRRLKIYGRPESSVEVAGKTIAAYDVRLCLEEDQTLVGRNLLLVREGVQSPQRLLVAVEGAGLNTEELERLLCDRLGLPGAKIMWLGDIRVRWGFREVLDRRELRSMGLNDSRENRR